MTIHKADGRHVFQTKILLKALTCSRNCRNHFTSQRSQYKLKGLGKRLSFQRLFSVSLSFHFNQGYGPLRHHGALLMLAIDDRHGATTSARLRRVFRSTSSHHRRSSIASIKQKFEAHRNAAESICDFAFIGTRGAVPGL